MYQADQQNIDAWKAEHGEIIRLKSAKYNKSAYFRKPNRKEMEFLSAGTKSSGLKFNSQLLKTCYLAGDKEIETNDDIFMGIGEQIMSLLTFDVVEVEKL
ncbi:MULTISPECIES: hypothetical protein [Bizionia]|uniref:Uncharacterized protein n=1 Tax=Bizionia algoritergicola TaxID=291187 RepID=A0A5D0R0H6_9FLAO|nr:MULTISPECIES: hypothetical protein [Bizionia]OBX20960.1 hypothetical protein BAA08_14575 [Bizionia sp. APA-3]TYB74589.1 hypothetical protein ES675_00145 [Bizionia algoritergicola]